MEFQVERLLIYYEESKIMEIEIVQVLQISFCPLGFRTENQGFTPQGECQLARKQHWRGDVIFGTILAVTHQGEASAGKLYPDLMAAAGVESNANQGGFSRGQPLKFQPGFFYTPALFLHHEHLVFGAVFK